MSKKKTPNKPMEDGKDSSFYSNVSRCIICLDEVRCRGKLSVCKHWFCYGCILEWSKNTNTCPVCKTRFRSISKVHLSPIKSPPTKVRVPDRDQRVWHDDADDGIPEELLYDIQNEMQEDMDDDYEPPGRLEYEDDLDEYDLEDSFIDDSSLFQASSHATQRLILTEDLDHATTTRDSPYMLRRRPGRSGPGTRGRDVTLGFYALDNTSGETEVIDISSEASSDSSLTDSESDEGEEENELTERARATRPSTRRASQRILSLRRTTRSQGSRSTRSQPPRRSTRSHAPTRSTRSQARLQEEQARNQRQRQDEMIAQNIQETGSSGWLSTRRANGGRAATASTSRGQAQAANHDSSAYKTRWSKNESTRQHARDDYSSSSKKELRRTIDHDDDTDDSDESEDDTEDNLPLKALVTRARADTQPRWKSSQSRSANDYGLSRSPRAQGTPRKQERKDACSPRNRFLSLETSLPSTSHAMEDDSTSNLNEVKKWKRIKMGKSNKGKENLAVSRTRRFFTQGASNMTLNDPDFNPILSDEIPSKRARQDTDNGGRGCKRQKSSRPRMACALERSLENNSNCRYSLRERIKGNVDDRDDDDDDDSDDKYSGKSMKSGATVTIMRQDTTDGDDDENINKEKRSKYTISLSRGYDDDDKNDIHKYTGKGKSYKASVRRSHDFEDDEDYVGKGKRLSTSVKCASDEYKNDFTDDDSIYNHDEQSNIIIPTPQPDRQRSLFTRRQHRTICAQFDDPLNAEEQPLDGRPTQTQPQFPANTGKRESCGHRNESKVSKVMASRKSGQQLIQCKECNDFTPELGSSNNHLNGSQWSNQTLVGRTRRRIKVYDSDSD